LRWMDEVTEVTKLKQQNETTKDRRKLTLVFEEAKAHRGLQRREEGWKIRLR